MTSRSVLRLLLPGALLYSCVLPSFENVPRGEEPVGGAINNQGGEGDRPGAGGSDAMAGAAEGGSSNPGAAPAPAADTYVLQQGKTLTVAARDGVLSNDEPSALTVTAVDALDPDRPEAFDAELEIARDGSLTFTPVPEFFGRYLARYTVEDAAGASATASVTFVVQPTLASLDAVAEGVGGVLLTGSSGEQLGTALTALGDVNDDGFDDFAVGAPGAASAAGAVYVVFGSAAFTGLTLGALSPTSNETAFAVLEGSADVPIGRHVSSAGKFNSDQIGDILIGSPEAVVDSVADDGTAFVVFGGAALRTSLTLTDMAEERGIAVLGAAFQAQELGAPVAGGGDFNGDTKADLLFGLFESGPTTKGVCVLMENPVEDAALESLTHATIEDGLLDLPLSLAFAGDINGDGKDDVLASSRGHVVLVLGDGNGTLPTTVTDVSTDGSAGGYRRQRAVGAPGVAAVAAAGDVNGDGKADFAYCDELGGTPTCVLVFGELAPGGALAPGDWQVVGFGASPALPLLATSADLNQDGFSDVVTADDGAAYVVFGRESGFGDVDVSSLGADGFALTAPTGGSIGAIATLGDVNGDGYVDFAAGDPTAAASSGRVYVVFGGPYSAEQR